MRSDASMDKEENPLAHRSTKHFVEQILIDVAAAHQICLNLPNL